MQGLITTYDKRKCTGRVQSNDGYIYSFSRKEIEKEEDLAYFAVDMEVEFEPKLDESTNQRIAQHIFLVDPESFENKQRFYNEPETFLFIKEDLVDGFDIFDRGLYAIERGERTEEKARYRLMMECQELKANAVVSYHCERKLKNAFGNGYYHYTARGVPVVIARPHADGDLRIEELKHRINQDMVKRNHNRVMNSKIGRMVIKALAAVCLIIFTLGFILTGGI